MRKSSKKDRMKSRKYCRYHKDHGHLTEQCQELGAFLEKLIKEGKIQEYATTDTTQPKSKKSKGKRPRSPTPESSNNEKRGTNLVNVIYGGGSIEESRSYTRKVLSTSTSDTKEKRPLQDDALYFTKDDTKGTLKQHEDPQVIEIYIGQKNRVTKMMIDTGSSVDILYIRAYNRMGGKIEDLTPP